MYDPETNAIRSFRLALRPFNCSHTAENILKMSSQIFQEFGIKHKVSFLYYSFAFIGFNFFYYWPQVMLVNSDNGANIKKGLLDLSNLEKSVKEEPLICVEEDIDDWTSYAASSDEIQSSSSSSDQDPPSSSISVQDVFHPVSLDEEQTWEDGDYTDVTKVINTLEDQFVQLIQNPRTRSLSRIPCFCHLLQVKLRNCYVNDFTTF